MSGTAGRWPFVVTCADCNASIADPTTEEAAVFFKTHYRTTIDQSSPSGTVGSQGEGTGGTSTPGACRPEFYEQCVIGSDGKCTRWSHYHYPEVES